MLLRTPLYHNTIISVLIPVAFALPKMPRGKPCWAHPKRASASFRHTVCHPRSKSV